MSCDYDIAKPIGPTGLYVEPLGSSAEQQHVTVPHLLEDPKGTIPRRTAAGLEPKPLRNYFWSTVAVQVN
jgi:hypothetical protein